jgi:hypothetical protein
MWRPLLAGVRSSGSLKTATSTSRGGEGESRGGGGRRGDGGGEFDSGQRRYYFGVRRGDQHRDHRKRGRIEILAFYMYNMYAFLRK